MGSRAHAPAPPNTHAHKCTQTLVIIVHFFVWLDTKIERTIVMVINLEIKTTRLLNEASGALFICQLLQRKLNVRTSVLIRNRPKARPFHARTLTPAAG